MPSCWRLLAVVFAQVNVACTSAKTPTRPPSSENSLSLTCDCPSRVVEEGNRLVSEGRAESAVEVYLTCAWDSIPNLAGLAERYDFAERALELVEKETWRLIQPPVVGEEVRRALQLARILGRSGAAAELFMMWEDAEVAERERLHRIIWLELASEGKWRMALQFEKQIVERLLTTGKYLSGLQHRDRTLIEESYTRQAFAYVALLDQADRSVEAERMLAEWEQKTRDRIGGPRFCELGKLWRRDSKAQLGATMTSALERCSGTSLGGED